MRSNSYGDLYPFYGNNGNSSTTALSITHDLWHRRLGHPNASAMSHIPLDFLSKCNKTTTVQSLCDACQLGKNTKLPFSLSHSRATMPFDLIHCVIPSFASLPTFLLSLTPPSDACKVTTEENSSPPLFASISHPTACLSASLAHTPHLKTDAPNA
jgi:hypothetical protein